jgi:hypothetical protein
MISLHAGIAVGWLIFSTQVSELLVENLYKLKQKVSQNEARQEINKMNLTLWMPEERFSP